MTNSYVSTTALLATFIPGIFGLNALIRPEAALRQFNFPSTSNIEARRVQHGLLRIYGIRNVVITSMMVQMWIADSHNMLGWASLIGSTQAIVDILVTRELTGSNPYVALRANALRTLVEMGFDPKTMVEHGIVWAEDQDPFGHVTQSRYMQFLGTCFNRVMESYDGYLNEEEYQQMITGKTVIPVVKKYKLDIKRQVRYPDALIAAYREDKIEPDKNHGTTVLFSITQQAIVAEVKGYTVYIDAKTGRPVDIRTVGGGWLKLFQGFSRKAVEASALREKWDEKHPRKPSKL
ncbi:hypothetical protein FSARC_12309 [Fusarium sarcochroum]|uniref:Uncharacterized protein n=1 Tax=Fusarium sarcochroum TaxID=1208366 RepID=A0A8H4WXP1_9HYPO|nr:hypothetical protein FSARC_12309 [Fusarium sarcochroum]